MDAWNANALIGARLGSSILERPLGIGGMGAVYLARQERPRRHVAVKVLRPGIAADEDAWELFLARFRREADAAAALDHANIVPIYEFGEQGTMAYIVMPYLSDGSLANFLAPDARLSVPEVADYIEQAAAALDYAHHYGIIHRDVKPSNLLLHPDGRLMLGDFGIARPLNMADLPAAALPFEGGDLTVTGAAMGTPEYMAPEQVRGEQVSAATDTYALGVVAYTLLSGHTPFEGRDINQVLVSHLTKTPQSLRSMRRDVSRDVEDAIAWAMAKDPSHRPGSTGAFARALRAASSGMPVASASSTGQRSRPNTLLAASGPRSYGGAPSVLASETDAGVPALRDGPDAPTLYDGAFRGGHGGFGAPAWPSATPPGDGQAAPMRPRTVGILALLGAAGVLLVTMAVVLASGALGNLLVSINPNNANNILPHPTATTQPTATPQPSPTPVANWLRLSKQEVTFGCNKKDRTTTVTLRNLSPNPTGWTATIDKQFTNGQVTMRPMTGELAGLSNKTITLNYQPGFIGLNATITITPTSDGAGDPPTLSVSGPTCGFGGGGGGGGGGGQQGQAQPLTPQHQVQRHGRHDGNGNGNGSGNGNN